MKILLFILSLIMAQAVFAAIANIPLTVRTHDYSSNVKLTLYISGPDREPPIELEPNDTVKKLLVGNPWELYVTSSHEKKYCAPPGKYLNFSNVNFKGLYFRN